MSAILIIWGLVVLAIGFAYVGHKANKNSAKCESAFDDRMFTGMLIVAPVVGLILTAIYFMIL